MPADHCDERSFLLLELKKRLKGARVLMSSGNAVKLSCEELDLDGDNGKRF